MIVEIVLCFLLALFSYILYLFAEFKKACENVFDCLLKDILILQNRIRVLEDENDNARKMFFSKINAKKEKKSSLGSNKTRSDNSKLGFF